MALLIVLSGCINSNKNKEIKDCGIDELCFAENIETCQPTKVTFTISDDLGSEVKYEEIQGNEKIGEENLCVVYIKVLDENIALDGEEQKTDLGKKLIEITENIKGKDMLCKFKVQLDNENSLLEVASLLKNLDPTTNIFQQNCVGGLKDEIINRAYEVQKILEQYETGDIYDSETAEGYYPLGDI